MSSISFDNVYLLLIAVPLIALFAIPFAIAVRKENRNKHNIASIVLHVVLAIVIAFAAAGTSMTFVMTETHVYVVADVSYSAKNNLDVIDGYIHDLELPRNSKLGLVCFGKTPELVSELGDPDDVKSVKEATVDDTETNISAALNFTGNLFETGVIKRIVLITDGTQTSRSEENSIRRAVDGLVTQNIKVDAIFLDDNPDPENYREVQISGVSLTEKVYLDSEQVAKVSVNTSYETSAEMTLMRGESIVEQKEVALTLGLNTVSFDLDTSAAGIFDYEVSIVAAGDASAYNNSYSFTQSVSEEMNVLALTQSWEDCVAIVERYGGKGTLDVYENDTSGTASAAEKRSYASQFAGNDNVNIYVNSMAVPTMLEELIKYDEIVLADVDPGAISNVTQFISSVDTAVALYGKSLVTMGNLYIQNREGDDLKQLEDMLPVRYGNNDDDPKLYTLVIDASRSMGHLYHLQVAKELSIRLVNLLNDSDYLSVFTFDGEVKSIYNAKTLKDREEIVKTLEQIEIANGTVIGSGMQRAYEQIRNLQYSEKSVMLITDGIAYGSDEYNPETVARQMRADGIATSVFDVGRQGDQPNGNNVVDKLQEARNMLRRVAAAGGGTYYYSNNTEYLDDVTFGKLTDDLTESVVEKETSVNVEIPRDEIFDGIDLLATGIPDVSGYVYGGTKPSATTVLTVNHERSTGATVEKPLFAYWNYGSGKVTTFTSSIGGWTKNWTDELKDTFFDNLYETNVPTEKNANPYEINIIREGSATRVEVELGVPRLGTSATITLTTPGSEPVTTEMAFNGSAYYYEFEAADVGKYSFDIVYSYNEVEFSETRAIYVCYLDEYDAFSVFDSTELHKAIDGRGTVSEDGHLKLENDPSEVGKIVYSFTIPLLIAAVVLFVVDVAVRKLKWADVKSFFGFGKKKEDKKQKEGKKS